MSVDDDPNITCINAPVLDNSKISISILELK